MSLILDALKKAQEERKTIFVAPEKKKKNISMEKPRRYYYYFLGGAICLSLVVYFLPMPKKKVPLQTQPKIVAKIDAISTEKTGKNLEDVKGSRKNMPLVSTEALPIKKEKPVKQADENIKNKMAKKTLSSDKDAPDTDKYLKKAQENVSLDEKDRVIIRKSDEERILTTFNMAVTENAKGNIEAAKRLYLKILEERPDYIEVLNNLGVIFMKEGNNNEALSYFRRLLEKAPNYTKAYNNIGIIAMRDGNKRLAEEYFRKAIEIDKGNMEAHINLSGLMRSEGRLKEAAQFLEPLIKRGNNEPSLYLSYAIIKDELGDSKEAAIYYRYYLRLSGKSTERNKVAERLKFLEDRDFTKNF